MQRAAVRSIPIEPPAFFIAGDENFTMPLTIDRLLAPHSLAEFQDAYYEKRPLLIQRQSPSYYDDLLTLRALNEHLGGAHLISTAVRLLRDGRNLDSDLFTYPSSSVNSYLSRGAVNKERVFAHFYDGYTINLMEYERQSAAVLLMRHEMERAFHGSAVTNIYLTPRNARGLKPHWDTHDTFILHFAGTKEWKIYDSPITLPARSQRFGPVGWTPCEPTMTATLQPGDFLYLPRGFVHEARATDTVSGHMTIGMFTYSYADLLRQIASNADVDPWLRRSLPIDFQSVASSEDFLRRVHRFFENADLPAYLERLHSDFAEDRLPDATDRLNDYVNLPFIDETSRFRVRSIVCHELIAGDGEAALSFDGRKLTFPAAAAGSIQLMIDESEFALSALPGVPAENLALCSTLVREGFLTIAGPPS